jgi:hypothetical protein
MKRLLRGSLATRAITAAGIDARRYWLLTDLFASLAERRELLTDLARDGVTLKIASCLYLLMGAALCLMFAAAPASASRYLGIFGLLTGVFLAGTLISEAGNSIVNPVEALVLSHYPIDGATYTAAKLTHLLRVVGYLAPALNAIPAFASLILLKEPFWYYPLIHLSMTYLVGLIVALSACAVFGGLLRFVPPARLKSVGQIVELMPFMAMMFGSQLWRQISPVVARWMPAGSAIRRNLEIAVPILAAIAVIMGLRSLSVDYLVRVAAIAHAGSGSKIKIRRSRVGDLVARWLGGPSARAGFAYTARMMRRDWTFRRQLLPMVPMSISPLIALYQGAATDPFSGKFTLLHVLPHVFGVLLFFMSVSMVYGSDYKGRWIFLLAPSRTFDGFARGVHGLLWLSIIGVPHAVFAGPMIWHWGPAHAGLFLAFSVATASLYLGLVLRLIDGVPFTKQPVTSRGVYFVGIVMIGALCIAAAVGVQYLLLFRSIAAVAITSAAVAVAALVVTRASLGTFAVAMRYNLSLDSAEVGTMFREVEG